MISHYMMVLANSLMVVYIMACHGIGSLFIYLIILSKIQLFNQYADEYYAIILSFHKL